MSIQQHTDFNAIFKNLTKLKYNFSLRNLIRAPFNTNTLQNQCFRTVNFEKVLCRSAFRKQFGLKQCAANLNTGFAFTHMSKDRFLALEQKQKEKHLHFENLFGPKRHTGVLKSIISKPKLHLKSKSETMVVLNVHWAAEQLVRTIKQKHNVKGVINGFIRDVKTLFRLWRSSSALKGVKVVVKGRLGRKKKALAQYAQFSAGVVPLSTVRAKIDFDQRVINTRFGSLGLKLWLCYT